jgi:anti-anti-sigma factor
MKTEIKKIGDTFIVYMDGKLDFETTVPLRETLNRLATDSVAKKVIFNLERLEFVGSSGISSFVQTLKDFNQRLPIRPRYCHVRSEFKKIIKAFDDEELFDFFENEDHAKSSFDH